MRCHEARSRLNESTRINPETDKELLQHLKQCRDCARVAAASDELCQVFADATVHDEAGGLAWAEQQRQVEAMAALTRTKQPKEMPFMSRLKKQFNLRPRLTLGLAAAVLVLIAGTVIPLKFDQTVGFEVAVAGVDRDLALNQEMLDQMLERLGLDNVTIDIKGCEATCNLVVSDLDSETDANMVRLAFQEIGSDDVLIELSEVHMDVSGSALGHAVSIWVSEDNAHLDEEGEFELQHIVMERLGDDFTCGENMFFVSEDGETVQLSEVGADGAEHGLTWVSDGEGNVSGEYGVFVSAVGADAGGVGCERVLYMTREDGCCKGAALIDPDDIVDGHLTDEAREALEVMGYEVEETNNGDGTLTVKLTKGDANNQEVMELQLNIDDDSAAKTGELPEGYALSQNYPNPFNPTTQIAYSLGQSGHVSLQIFNIRGQLIKTLVEDMMPAGDHTIEWNATNDSGDRVASGVYLYRLQAGEVVQSKKMTLVK